MGKGWRRGRERGGFQLVARRHFTPSLRASSFFFFFVTFRVDVSETRQLVVGQVKRRHRESVSKLPFEFRGYEIMIFVVENMINTEENKWDCSQDRLLSRSILSFNFFFSFLFFRDY